MNIIKILEKIALITILFFICFSLFFEMPSYASEVPDEGYEGSAVAGDADKGLPSLNDNYKPKASNGKPIEIVEKILGVLTIIGVIAMVIVVAVMGFGLILGSASDKALKQEQMVGLLIAAALITGGSLIARIIISAAESM